MGGFEHIYVALQMLRPDGVIIALLPDDFFDGTQGLLRLSKILSFEYKIVARYMTGRWDYYPVFDGDGNVTGSANPKFTCDSIWVIQRFDAKVDEIGKQFVYTTYHSLIDGSIDGNIR